MMLSSLFICSNLLRSASIMYSFMSKMHNDPTSKMYLMMIMVGLKGVLCFVVMVVFVVVVMRLC